MLTSDGSLPRDCLLSASEYCLKVSINFNTNFNVGAPNSATLVDHGTKKLNKH